MKKYLLTILIILLIFYYLNNSGEGFLNCKFDGNDKKLFDNKQYILILLDKNKSNNRESEILINLLKQIKKYNFKIYQNKIEFYTALKNINKVKLKCVFIFQDILSDCNLNVVNIKEMIDYMKFLNDKHNICIYPKIEDMNFFASKKYYSLLKKNMNYSILPSLEVIEIKDFSKDKLINLLNKIEFYAGRLFKKFDHVLINKGYNSKKNIILSRGILNCRKKLIQKILYLEDANLIEKNVSLDCESNVSKVYIIQGFYNIKKKNRISEYKILFLNGNQKYISLGDNFPNLCVEDVYCNINKNYDSDNLSSNLIIDNIINNLNNVDKEITKYVLAFSKIVYKDFINTYFRGKHPLIFNLNISWSDYKGVQDKHTLYLKESKKWIRLYINDLDLRPKNFLYDNILSKNNESINSNIQNDLLKLIFNYL